MVDLKTRTESFTRVFVAAILFSFHIPVAHGVPPVGGVNSTVSSFFNVTPQTERPAAHTNVALNQIFSTGIGPYTSAMAGQIYPYPLTIGGVAGAPLYNGCYDRKNNRISNLDANNNCSIAMTARPNDAIFRLFIGYKIGCSGTPNAANICPDTDLIMNCEYTQVQTGPGTFENATAPIRQCSTDRGIRRRAKGNAANTPAWIGCHPGENGTSYPACTPCAAGTYNSTFDPNDVACTPCTKTVQFSTGFTLTSPVGSVSVNDCRVVPGTLTCQSGYTPSTDGQSCETVPAPCSLNIAVSPQNPSPGMSDGAITASYSGVTGTASGLTIIAPSSIAPSSGGTGSPATFSGLAQGTYTLSVSDSACNRTVDVTLTDSTAIPLCTACPAGSTVSGSTCVTAPTTIPGTTNYGYRCMGYGGCTSQPCYPTCQQGSNFGQVSQSDTTPRVCDGAQLWTNFGGSCTFQSGPTTSPPTQGCPTGFTLAAGTCSMPCTGGATCNLNLSLSKVDPSVNGASDGSITATSSGNVGTVTVTYSAASGSSPSAPPVSTITGLIAAPYSVTVTDAGVPSCSRTQSITLNDPSATCPYAPPMSLIATGSPAGDVTANLFNNVGTLTSIHWTRPATGSWLVSGPTGATLTGSGVPAGTYTILAVDPANTNCTASATVTVGTAPPGCDPILTNASAYPGGLECKYQCAGPPVPYIYRTVTSGTCGIVPGQNAEEAAAETILGCTTGVIPNSTGGTAGQIAGPAEASGCTFNPACDISASITSSTNPTTTGGADGTITISVTGNQQSPQVRDNGTSVATLPSGSAPQSYTITGRSAGAHTITVRNQAGNGCTTTAGSVTLTDPPASCNPSTTLATSTLRVNCSYTCSSSPNFPAPAYPLARGKYIGVGETCTSAAAMSRVAQTSCVGATAVSCFSGPATSYSGVWEDCSTITCPVGKQKVVLWDVGGLIHYNNNYGGVGASGSTCAHSQGGPSLYVSCGNTSTPIDASMAQCPQGYFAIYQNGYPYCTE